MGKVKMTIEQLESLVERLKNRQKYDNMVSYVYISENAHPNGRKLIEFEQPCSYGDCDSNYYRYDEQK